MFVKKGSRKYECDECKERSYHHWIAFNRASRPKCPKCGCSRLELVSEEAKEERANLQQLRVTGHRSMTYPPTGSVSKKVT